MENEKLLTVEDVANYLQLNNATIRGLARNGKIQGVKIERDWRFKKESIDNYIESLKNNEQ